MITLNKKYAPLFNNDTRFFLITGGRGSSKSFGVGTFINLLSFETGHRILFTRQTMTSAHLSIIPEFQEKIDLMELNDHFTITKNEITNLQSGSEIIFRGIKTSSGDQTASLKSLQGVTTWILDEAEELTDETTFDKINLSIRQKGKQNRVILILNPSTKEHWIYKRFFESEGVTEGFNGVKGNTTYIHTTYQDNIENLDESFIAEVERMKVINPKKFQHVILGGWIDEIEGVLIPSSKLKFEDIHKYTLNDTVWRFAIADPANKGGDNYSMLFCWVVNVGDHFQIVVRDVIYSKDGIESLTDRIVEKLHENLIEEVLLEVNGVGLASYMLVKREIENHCKAVPFTTKENKEVKILSNYEGVIKYMVFDDNYKSNAEHSNFISHLTSYKRDKNESQNKHKLDAIDNASMAVKAFKLKFANVLYGKK